MLSMFNEIGKRAPWFAAAITVVAILVAIFASSAVASESFSSPVLASESTTSVTGQTSIRRQRRILNLKVARRRSSIQARKECKRREIFIDFGVPYRRCEGWFAGNCVRQSLSNPYYGTCHLNFFMDDARQGELNCDKIQGWKSSRFTGASTIRTKRGTTPWSCWWANNPPG
jgi:hypothetical protein